MITKLEELTVAGFVDLVCGNVSVLDPGTAGKDEIARTVRAIVYEYRRISDKGSARRYLMESEARAKAKGALVLFKMCSNLLALGQYDRVRTVMEEYGVAASGMDEARLKAEVSSRIAKAERDSEACVETGLPEDTRESFDAQTAAMMTHFKFQIDTTTMKANIYAHLVDRFRRDAEALRSVLRR